MYFDRAIGHLDVRQQPERVDQACAIRECSLPNRDAQRFRGTIVKGGDRALVPACPGENIGVLGAQKLDGRAAPPWKNDTTAGSLSKTSPTTLKDG